jgi:hypothetical protein
MILNIVKSLTMGAGDIAKKSAVSIPIRIAGRNNLTHRDLLFTKFNNLTLSYLHVDQI